MTNMAEYGNKSHAQKNRPIFFPLCVLYCDMTEESGVRFAWIFFPEKGNG